jgi:hypothetical protein
MARSPGPLSLGISQEGGGKRRKKRTQPLEAKPLCRKDRANNCGLGKKMRKLLNATKVL